MKWCWQNWQPSEGLILLIVDDITDWESCRELLPTANRFRVLITTRRRNLDPSYIEEISLEVLSPEAALQLLTELVGDRVLRAGQKGVELCQQLGYLPLGLQLVGRYLAEDPDLSLREMLQRLKAKESEDKKLSNPQLAVLAAFELSWDELMPMVQLVGQLLSLFVPDLISWNSVESVGQLLDWNLSDVNDAKKQLYKRYLIQRVEDSDGCYKIHPLIQEFLTRKLVAAEKANDLKRAFAATFVKIAQQIPESLTLESIQSVKDAIPHLEEVAQNLTDAVDDKNLIWIFVGLGRFYQGQGLYAIAEPYYTRCLSVVRERLGEEHPLVATSLNNLASLYDHQGRYAEAEPLYQQALKTGECSLGVDHPTTIIIRKNLDRCHSSITKNLDNDESWSVKKVVFSIKDFFRNF